MITWRTHILALALIAASSCLADVRGDSEVTLAQYGEQLDRLLSATRQLDKSSGQTTELLRDLPLSWQVRDGEKTFKISTEWLRQDLRRIQEKPDPALATTIQERLKVLRADLDGYQKVPDDTSSKRALLANILAQREFRDVHGPTWLDRFKQRLLAFIVSILERLFQSSAIPTIGKLFVYGLVGVAVAALAIWAYRRIRSDAALERIVPDTVPVSAKEWTVWMAEAREAADKGKWPDAIHLAYWAGISFLEAQGLWKPDRARTPREYLRLLPSSNAQHATLAALTGSFEIVWYGARTADAKAFSQAIAELEKLGCHSS